MELNGLSVSLAIAKLTYTPCVNHWTNDNAQFTIPQYLITVNTDPHTSAFNSFYSKPATVISTISVAYTGLWSQLPHFSFENMK